ncbi:cytochrome P450 [Hyaloraphidium curvatum]|nr:cytochrome P450 [Hyaloraphidium curvatum]
MAFSVSATELLLLVIAIVVTRRFVDHAYKVLYSPVAKIPGPQLPRWAPFLFFLPNALRGKAFDASYRLHEKYGPVVAAAIDRVSVADPALAHMVLKTLDLPKSKVYNLLRRRDQPDNIFSTLDKAFHKRERRLIGPAFANQIVNSLEPLMLEVVSHLFSKIDQTMAAEGRFDFGRGIQNLAQDVIGETAFGQSFNMVERGTHPLHESRRVLFLFTAVRRILYILVGWIPYLHLDERIMDMFPQLRRAAKVNEDFVSGVIRDRKALLEEHARGGSKAEFGRHDILNVLLTHSDPDTGERLTDAQVATNVGIILIAGAETTANSLTWAVYFLLKNPRALGALRAELDAAFPDASTRGPLGFDPLPHETLRKLPYLDASIKEALRIMPVAGVGLPREADRDLDLGGYLIPKGTMIGVAVFALHRSPKLWQRAGEFWPERFLGEEEEEKGDGPKRYNKEAFVPFSLGTRNCVGMNFAWMEMKVVLAHLVRYYDLGLVPGQQDKEAEAVSYITLQPRSGSLLITAERRA